METEEKNKTMMLSYYDLLRDILENGTDGDDRTGTGTRSLFGKQLRFDLSDGFPLLPGKYTPFKLVATELLWFLSGSTNNEDLRKLNGNNRDTIWEEWSSNGESVRSEKGSIGPLYPEQWREWFNISGDAVKTIDQIANLIEGIRRNPNSRRHIVSAWNVADLPDEHKSIQQNLDNNKMGLAPCHYCFQMDVTKGKLSCLVNIRSSDTFLGLPFNIASYALLTHMIAEVCNLKLGDLIVSIGNAHIYHNHIDQVNELLSRDLTAFPLPILHIERTIKSIDDFKLEDFKVINYQSYSSISAPVAI